MKPGRNDPCSCGSGKKFKHCCEGKGTTPTAARPAAPSADDASQLLALFNAGRFAEAENRASMLVGRYPKFANGWKILGATLHLQGKDCLPAFRRAVELFPDDAEALSNLGNALKDLGQYAEAAENYRRAVQLKPSLSGAHYNLGTVFQETGQATEAVACYRKAIKIKPDFSEAYNNLGNTLKEVLKLDEALECYRLALKFKPNYVEAYSNLLFCLSHTGAMDARELFAEHCRFAKRFETPYQKDWLEHNNIRDPNRQLQIGFVSGDLRNHAVANFFEPLLAHLVGYPQLSLHAYYNHTVEDKVTKRIREYLPNWNQVARLSNAALAHKIRSDKIDILIDLSGHTAHHRLVTFSQKPAPVQISWIGYPGTTGLSAMDYYFADRFLLPAGLYDDFFTEKIVRLPANVPFLPNEIAPPLNSLPAIVNGHITFGSFNRPSKINRQVIALWSKLLRALPNSRMLLGGLPKDANHELLTAWFLEENISQDRLEFHVRSEMEQYLGLHHRVDICLDTFPYNGGTTTLHALWMGVPTLTLAGRTAAGRSGVSAQSHVGLKEFIANNSEDFVQKGLYWNNNLDALSEIRAGLRGRFEKSAFGNPAKIAAGVENAFRIIWQRWCLQLPVESFEVLMNNIEQRGPKIE